MSSSKTRVAIIGAGAAGLVMARHINSQPEIYNFVVFEQINTIGGTWVYTDDIEVDKNGLPVHSSMYKGLRTNLPKEVMQIPDFPFDDSIGPSFVHHSVIQQYLLDYANHFDLHPHITLNTLVEYVEPEKLSDGKVVWTLTYLDLSSRIRHTNTFDAIILCNGHYNEPHVPKIPGIEKFKGIALHSHHYREPEMFDGKNVCILGASSSGIDICLEVSNYANKIYLSHNLLKQLELQVLKNVEQRPGIESINGDNFTFRDGSSAEAEVLIYCTGYEFTYPFLSSKVTLRTQDNHVEPIYKHITHMDWPNLFFMGTLGVVIPFPLFDIQAQYILGVIEGRIMLPSKEQMYEEFENEKKSLLDKGVMIRHISKMGERAWSYYEEIALAAGVPGFAPVIKNIYDYNQKMRKKNLTNYKNYKYRIIDNENFEVTLFE